jgi:lysophospholipid acyltransferase (LPLAT)-like uncharacterized protein
LRIRSRSLNWIIVAGAVLLARLLFRTLRIRYILADPQTNPYEAEGDKSFLYCVWHDAMTVAIFARPHPRTVALVSRHQDGSYLSNALRMLGIGTVRGSSSSGGATAMRSLLGLPTRAHIVMTPDGPRGPRRKIKPGLAYLASRSGRPIVPTAFSAVRCWRIGGSWTDLMIPKPFSRVFAMTGEPITVAPDATDEELAECGRKVQAEMDRLADLADELVAAAGKPATKSSVSWNQRSRHSVTTCRAAA